LNRQRFGALSACSLKDLINSNPYVRSAQSFEDSMFADSTNQIAIMLATLNA